MGAHNPTRRELAQRIHHEGEIRKEQRRADQAALHAAASGIEGRLAVLSTEGDRIGVIGSTYATRAEVNLAYEAISAKVEALSATVTTEIRALRESRERDLGYKAQESEGKERSQWTFERVLTIIAIAVAVYAVYAASQGG